MQLYYSYTPLGLYLLKRAVIIMHKRIKAEIKERRRTSKRSSAPTENEGKNMLAKPVEQVSPSQEDMKALKLAFKKATHAIQVFCHCIQLVGTGVKFYTKHTAKGTTKKCSNYITTNERLEALQYYVLYTGMALQDFIIAFHDDSTANKFREPKKKATTTSNTEKK